MDVITVPDLSEIGAIALLLLLLSLGVAYFSLRRFTRPPKSSRHERNTLKSMRVINKLISIPNPAQKFAYLRTIDPFVFEELILSAFEKKGVRVHRNPRYTGDGGIDGKIEIDGKLIYIQAKRYKSHISASDVQNFHGLCQRDGVQGIFVHTGKTGKASWRAAETDLIKIVSGASLLKLIATPTQSQQSVADSKEV